MHRLHLYASQGLLTFLGAFNLRLFVNNYCIIPFCDCTLQFVITMADLSHTDWSTVFREVDGRKEF